MAREITFDGVLESSEFDYVSPGKRPLEALLNDPTSSFNVVPFGTGSFIKSTEFTKSHSNYHYPGEAVVVGPDSHLVNNVSFSIDSDKLIPTRSNGTLLIENMFGADEIRFDARMGYILPDVINKKILVKKAKAYSSGRGGDEKVAFPINFSIGGEEWKSLIPVIVYSGEAIYLFSIDPSLLPKVKERIEVDLPHIDFDEMPSVSQRGDYDREFLKRKAETNTSEIKPSTKFVNQSVRSMPRPYTPFRELSPSEIREEQLKKRLANLRKELNDIYKGGNRGSGTKDNASFLRKEISKVEGQVVRSKRRPY